MSENTEYAFFAGRREGIKVGVEAERRRCLLIMKSYYCGEPGCKKHAVDWEDLLANIAEVGDGIDLASTETETKCNCKKQP